MQRRTLLTAGSALLTTTVAGCSAVESFMESEQYKSGLDGDAFLPHDLPADAPDDMNNHHDENETFARMWMTDDESIFVLAHGETFETIEDAENEFETTKATASDDESYPLGDQAIIYEENDENARVKIQHSNLTMQTLAARASGTQLVPDRSRASDYADLLFDEVKSED